MRKALLVAVVLNFAILSMTTRAEADPGFPSDWAKWNKVTTPLVKIGALPDCKADVHTLPPIYQETVATYCGVKAGGPGKVEVLVKPASAAIYDARKGNFPDGSNLILHLMDMKVLFVTSHKGGEASYSVYSEDGKNITAPSGPLSSGTCTTCHTGYTAFCVSGQCGKVSK